MATRVVCIAAYFILVVIPFFSVTEQFFQEIGQGNLVGYLTFGSGIWILMLLLLAAVSRKDGFYNRPVNMAIGLCFLIGMLVLFPLHLGPPKESPELLQHLAVEHFRYLILLLSVFVFILGNYAILVTLGMHIHIGGRIVLILILAAALINLWDNYDSLTFGSKMKAWIATGKHARDFFPSYDYHQWGRTVGRALLYMVSGIISFQLWRHQVVAGGRACILILFCMTGVLFGLLFILNGPLYYFPFMVPAVALAPTYWTGLALLASKTSARQTRAIPDQD